ncbi:hypothetical protein K8B33_14130 [Alcanivorax sp. JB21]|uniref:hypothetical protein n=1 Tax=Alcanivorax limicola TaxID=2874102 RepID=UPI001CBBBC89|nr:hypothetical protein [Alcanivorax limicola]MBZ2190243.1 hypothetical protein [Alcanivorax limicola]
MITTIKWPLISLATVTLMACGGTSNQDGSRQGAAGTEGRVTINGGLAGAKIFVDMNDSASHDEGEPVGYTDGQGFFGYNPITRINYCRSDNPLHRRHCLRLPSLDNLPDEVTVFYLGGVDRVTGEQNEKVYRYHVQVDALRGRTLDLNGALAMVSAAADSDDSLDLLYGIIDAFYQHHQHDLEQAPAPLAHAPVGRTSSLDAQAKFDALVAAGIFQGVDEDTSLNEDMTRAGVAQLLSRLFSLPSEPPQSDHVDNISGPQWAAGYLAAIKAGALPEQPDGTFMPNAPLSIEEFAVLLVKTIGAEDTPQDGNIPDWAEAYLAAAVDLGLMAFSGYDSAATRAQLLQATLFIRDALMPDLDPQTHNQLSSAAQQLMKALNEDADLNDSFSTNDFDLLLESLIGLSQEADSSDRRINLASLMAFLRDTARDMQNASLEDFLLDKDFFDSAIASLTSNVIDIQYTDPVTGNDGQAQLLLTPAPGDNLIDGGLLQACVRYTQTGTPQNDQLFGTPQYVSGEWSRLNDNALLLSLNVIPGTVYNRVMQLDWEQVAANDLNSIGFDLTDRLEAWDMTLLSDIDYRWATLGNDQHTANATCAVFLD